MSVIILPRNQDFGTAEIQIKTKQTEAKFSVCVLLFIIKITHIIKLKHQLIVCVQGVFQNLDLTASGTLNQLKSKCS